METLSLLHLLGRTGYCESKVLLDCKLLYLFNIHLVQSRDFLFSIPDNINALLAS